MVVCLSVNKSAFYFHFLLPYVLSLCTSVMHSSSNYLVSRGSEGGHVTRFLDVPPVYSGRYWMRRHCAYTSLYSTSSRSFSQWVDTAAANKI